MKKFFLLCIIWAYYLPVTFAQTITTIAGTGIWGYSGDGGPATAAKFYEPMGIALSPSGDLFIADHFNNRIRKISPSGIITTIAGNGSPGYSGDGGPATAAALDTPYYVALDTGGNIYVSTANNVRKIDHTGTITTFAGVPGIVGYSGDGGLATAAYFHQTLGIASDHAGNVYICDHGSYCVRKVDPSGIVTTFAGNGTFGDSGDGLPATDAQIVPQEITIDAVGNVLISDLNFRTIRKVNLAGIISTIAGISGMFGFSGDGGPATDAMLYDPAQLATDTAGNLFIIDGANDRIRKVDNAGIINTIAGNGSHIHSGDGGPATACGFRSICGIALNEDCGETIYISDYLGSHIRKIVYYNSPPVFTAGHTHSINVCAGEGFSLDPMLSITDSDMGQPETWYIVQPAAHGIVVATYSAISTGGVITPSGVSYTPAIGYVGTDTFKIAVCDCGNVPDTTTFYVTINALPVAGAISGQGMVCAGDTIMLFDTAISGVWSAGNGRASVLAGIVTGVSVGADTIRYSVTNTCGTATATHIVTVKGCEAGVGNIMANEGLKIFPNPGDGTFTISLSSGVNEHARIIITNTVGEKVKEFSTITNKEANITLDAPAGVYFISAVTAGGVWSGKVVIR